MLFFNQKLRVANFEVGCVSKTPLKRLHDTNLDAKRLSKPQHIICSNKIQ